MAPSTARTAFVSGSTGYIGSNLVLELAAHGWKVKALTRDTSKTSAQPWAHLIQDQGELAPGRVEVVCAEISDTDTLEAAMADVDVAWYLVHSMAAGSDFREEDRTMARSFAQAASGAAVKRMVYLGGLHPDGEELSEHLASRVEVGEILMESGVPTACLQAGVVLGEGSESFIMLRHLSERLPGAIGPAWITHKITPISVRDVMFYLRRAADLSCEHNRTFDIGSDESLAYSQMLKRYADLCLRVPRISITAPVLNQKIAAWGISLMTPVSYAMAAPLIGSLVHDTVAKERDLQELVGTPEGGNQSFEEAIRAATADLDTGRWMRTVRYCAAAVGSCMLAGSILTDPQGRWYTQLKKPSWQPPGWVFPLVWTPLYADIALNSALVIADALEEKDHQKARSYAVSLGTNLVLNAAWSGLFFRSKRPWISAAEAALLALSSADLVRQAGKSAPARGALLAPYALWTGFATVLNTRIAMLNPSSAEDPVLRRTLRRLSVGSQ